MWLKCLLIVGVLLLLLVTNQMVNNYSDMYMPVDKSGYSELYSVLKHRVITKQEAKILDDKGVKYGRYALNKDLFEKKVAFYRYFLLLPIGCFALFLIGKRFLINRLLLLFGVVIFIVLIPSFGVWQSVLFVLSFSLGAYYKKLKVMRAKDFKA